MLPEDGYSLFVIHGCDPKRGSPTAVTAAPMAIHRKKPSMRPRRIMVRPHSGIASETANRIQKPTLLPITRHCGAFHPQREVYS